MGLTSSDLLEELLYEAYDLGVLDELRDKVSKIHTTSHHNILPIYEEVFLSIKKTLD
jgi:hypothetical protein